MNIQSLTIDSTKSKTFLCTLGEIHKTDKSPYNPLHYKHAYTAVYNLIFSNIRFNKIKLLEIGILDNASMKCWRDFFPNAKLVGAEFNQNLINKAVKDNLFDTTYVNINIRNKNNVTEVLDSLGKFDIIIDDSTHDVKDQLSLLEISYKYLNAGGILVIEDIFKHIDENVFFEKMSAVEKYFCSATFIYAEHELKYSGDWNNDKLLVLHRNTLD